MQSVDKLFDNLPQILQVIESNNQGFIALIWIVTGIALYFIFRKSSDKIRATLFVFSISGIFFLAYIVINANNVIVAKESGWVYYEVDAAGQVTAADGRIDSLDPKLRQYWELKIGGELKTREESPLRVAPKKSSPVLSYSAERACFKIIELNNPFPVKVANSGGWIKVKTISCV